MRTTTWVLIVILSCYLCSCGERPYPHTLQTADSIAGMHPDSALYLLEQLADSIGHEPEATQMYYRLLTVKARDKAYIPHTSDSLIMQVLHYYRSKKYTKHLPMAYYYAGRVYSDLGDAPQALEYFQRAVRASEKNADYRLMNKIYSQIGTLYLYQDIYGKAPEMFRKAYHYGTLLKDSVGMVYELRDIGRSFTTLKQADSAVYYYKQADSLARKIKNLHMRGVVNSELAGYYTELGRYEEAYEAIQIALAQPRTLNLPPLHSTIAYYYENTNQLDSAAYYYTQLLHTNNYIFKKEASRGLYSIAKQQGETNTALSYLEHYSTYADSVQSMNQEESVRKIGALYNYQLNQEEYRRLRMQAFREKRLKVFFGIAFVVSIILSIAYREHHKRKEQSKQIQQQKLKKIQEKQYKLSLAQIEKNKKEIKALAISLKEAETAQDQLQQDLLRAQKELIEKNNEQIEVTQKLRSQTENKLLQSGIYKKFHNAGKENENENEEERKEKKIKTNSTDWQELNQAIDEAYSQFSQRLQEIHPITNIELQVCLLLKIDIPPLQISTIITRSKQAVTSIRKRLYKKFFNEEGSTEQWDNFIRNF